MRCRRPHILVPLAAAAAICVAGCGGGSSPGVANVNSSTSSSSASSTASGGSPSETQIQLEEHDAVRFAQCVRSHGVPNFPNPEVAPRAYKDAFNAQSPAFGSAYTTCGHLLPPGHRQSNQSPARTRAQTAALLAFARCLRSHGLPSFPDPTSSGELSREMLAKAGIDIHEPAVVHAADGCTGVTHGVITKSVVAKFVAGH